MGYVSVTYGYHLGGVYAMIVPLAIAVVVMSVAPAVTKKASKPQEQEAPA